MIVNYHKWCLMVTPLSTYCGDCGDYKPAAVSEDAVVLRLPLLTACTIHWLRHLDAKWRFAFACLRTNDELLALFAKSPLSCLILAELPMFLLLKVTPLRPRTVGLLLWNEVDWLLPHLQTSMAMCGSALMISAYKTLVTIAASLTGHSSLEHTRSKHKL